MLEGQTSNFLLFDVLNVSPFISPTTRHENKLSYKLFTMFLNNIYETKINTFEKNSEKKLSS